MILESGTLSLLYKNKHCRSRKGFLAIFVFTVMPNAVMGFGTMFQDMLPQNMAPWHVQHQGEEIEKWQE